jgi:hypothetical protein
MSKSGKNHPVQGGFRFFSDNYLNMTFAYYLVIDKYSTAIFTYYDLFPRFDIKLPLRWNLVETTSAGITLLTSTQGHPEL